MASYKIAVIDGDGIGPEVVGSAKRILAKITEKTGIEFEFIPAPGGDEMYEKCGETLPESSFQACEKADAIMKGPVGERAAEIVLPLRQRLNLYANLRPAATFDGVEIPNKPMDIMVVRENTEGLYMSEEIVTENEVRSIRKVSREASERIARTAFDIARGRDKKVTCVDKANVIRKGCGLFRESVLNVAKEYPDVEVNTMYVDACAMNLILRPEIFDVIVTTNMFGDILSDEAAALIGSLGLAMSANIGDDKAMFEPVHGCAPDIAGKDISNPVAMIMSTGLMLDWLGEKDAAQMIDKAVRAQLKEGAVLTPDLGGSATNTQVTDSIIAKL